jgi:hypothetical protein
MKLGCPSLECSANCFSSSRADSILTRSPPLSPSVYVPHAAAHLLRNAILTSLLTHIHTKYRLPNLACKLLVCLSTAKHSPKSPVLLEIMLVQRNWAI